MTKTIYESGTIGGLSGFHIAHERNSIYGIHITDPLWGAVTPEELREAADAIERHRDRVLVEFEDNSNDEYRVKLNPEGGLKVEPVGDSNHNLDLDCERLEELIQKVINVKEASSV